MRLCTGKKGYEITIGTVVFFILLAASFLLLVLWYFQAHAAVKEDEAITRCRLSVIKASALRVGPKTLIELDCPRIRREVELKDVKGSKGEIDSNLVKKAMADEIRDCWSKMGEGSAKGFNTNIFGSIWAAVGFTPQDNYVCLLCSTISYDEEVQKAYYEKNRKHEVDNFMAYLKDSRISQNSGQSYYDYLSNRENVNVSTLFYVATIQGTDSLEIPERFDIRKEQHIFYVVYKGEYLITAFADTAEWIKSQLGVDFDLRLLNKDEAYGFIHIADQDNMHNLKCGALVN